jgi:hypothetical protein
MAIRAVELQGVVQRSQDIGQIKQNQDAKPMADQNNIHVQMDRQVERQHNQVTKFDNPDKKNDKYDAKEKGNGFYFSKKKGKNRKPVDEEDGSVTIKAPHAHFDIKI